MSQAVVIVACASAAIVMLLAVASQVAAVMGEAVRMLRAKLAADEARAAILHDEHVRALQATRAVAEQQARMCAAQAGLIEAQFSMASKTSDQQRH